MTNHDKPTNETRTQRIDMTMALYRSANVLDPLDYAEGHWGCTRMDCRNPLSGEWDTI